MLSIKTHRNVYSQPFKTFKIFIGKRRIATGSYGAGYFWVRLGVEGTGISIVTSCAPKTFSERTRKRKYIEVFGYRIKALPRADGV